MHPKILETLREYFMSRDRDNIIRGDLTPDLSGVRDLGTASLPFREIHALNLVGGTTSGTHVLASTGGLGSSHTVSGLTSGQVLRATGATTAAFQSLVATDLPSHVLATTSGLGAQHSVSGLTSGQVLKATGTTTAEFIQLSHTELSSIGSNTHAQIDSHIADTSDPHGSTMSVSVKVQTPEVENTGNLTLDAINAAANSTVYVLNSDATYKADLNVENDIVVGGTVDTVDLAAFKTTYDAHDHSASDPTQVSHANLTSVTSDQHHAQSHVLATTAGLGTDHSTSGLTAGQVLRATGTTTAAFQSLVAGDLPAHTHSHDTDLTGVSSDDHHAQVHALSGSDHTGDLTFTQLDSLTAAPTIALGTSGSIGTASTIIRSDATITAFDVTVPTTIQPDDAAATGSVAYAARRDHTHGIVTAVAGSITPDAIASEGSATSFSRSDHVHGIVTAVPSTVLVQTNTEGSATSFARSDHLHNVSTGTPVAVDLSANSAGSATSLARSDHKHDLDESIVPTWTGLHTFQRSTEQVRIGYDGSNYASFTVGAGGNLTVAPTGDWIFDPTGNDILPNTNYDLNIGSLSKKYKQLYASELWVETLVAQNTIATIGGRILVGPTTTITTDSSSWTQELLATETGDIIVTEAGDSLQLWYTVTVEHNEMAVNDTVYMEANGSVEFFGVAAGPTGAGPYTYDLVRDLDGTGENTWYAGDAVFNTGTTGDGFIDLYSFSGVNAGTGPTIAGNVRNSTTYNDWTEHWAIGNLNGLYGYGVDTYGVGLGKYNSANYLTIDATNGIRFFNSAGTTLAQLSGSTWTLGDTSNEHVKISSTGTEIYDDTTLLALYAASTTFYDIAGADRLVLGTAGITIGDSTEGEYISVDSTNGIKMYGGGTLYTQLSNAGVLTLGDSGNEHAIIDSSGMTIKDNTVTLANFGSTVTVGEVGASKSNVYITAGEIQLRNNTTAKITLDSSGDVSLTGSLDIGTSGVLKSGQTAYDTGTGYWLEYNGGTPRLSIGDDAGNKLLWDGSSLAYTGGLAGGQFDGVLSISASGGIYQGTGTFASPTTGLKIYNSGGTGLLEMWGSGTKQVYMDTSGQLMAGGGNVTLNSDGIDLAPSSTAYVQWTTGVTGAGAASLTAWLNLTPSPDTFTLYQSVSTAGGAQGYNASHWLETSSSAGYASLRVDADSSAITFEGDANPYTTDSYDVGTTSLRWNDYHYSGDLKPYRNSTTYTGYVLVPLTSPLTSTSWDGDTYSSTTKTKIDLSAVFGAPAGIKAVLLGVAVKDSGAASSECWMRLAPDNTAGSGMGIECPISNTRYQMAEMTVPCDASGDIYYEIQASGTNTFEVWIYLWGYYL